VLVQKPMATRWEDALALWEAWRASGHMGMALPYSDAAACRPCGTSCGKAQLSTTRTGIC
jgi:hypothetical protein